jgi:starch synthase
MTTDLVTTVSDTYALEIQTPEFGMGLDGFLRERSDKIVGIVNGVDYAVWDPGTDTRLPHHYSAGDLSGKRANKRYLLDNLGLEHHDGVPVVGMVTRLVSQKGIDILYDALPEVLARRDVQLAVLGSGEPTYEAFFTQLQVAFPEKVSFYQGYHARLAALIEAGSDMFLMPSLYEPCGLNQMYSLRYGSVPIVRRTGGLADTVQLFNPRTGEGTGIVFDHYEPYAVRRALEAALDLYQNRSAWDLLVRNGRAQDYSWERQVGHYVDQYERLLERNGDDGG